MRRDGERRETYRQPPRLQPSIAIVLLGRRHKFGDAVLCARAKTQREMPIAAIMAATHISSDPMAGRARDIIEWRNMWREAVTSGSNTRQQRQCREHAACEWRNRRAVGALARHACREGP